MFTITVHTLDKQRGEAGSGLQASGGDPHAEVQGGRQEGLQEALSAQHDGAGGEGVQPHLPREYSLSTVEVY